MIARRAFLAAAPLLVAAARTAVSAQAVQEGNWLGTVGMIKPTMRPGSMESLLRLLPDGIGALPVYLDVKRGTEDEFASAIPAYEKDVALLAAQKVDLISAEGAPPFMIPGFKGETDLIRGWEAKYKTRILTASRNQVDALNALNIKKFVGAAYTAASLNQIYVKYFTEAGFHVLSMDSLEGVQFEKVQDVPSSLIYGFIKRHFLQHPEADGIYMLGSGWRTLDIIEPLEQDLQVPVVHAIACRAWEIQKILHVHRPRTGYGKLLAALP